MNIVLIPVFKRPEFLTACLDYIRAAEGCDNYEYWFLCDKGCDKGNINVINRFPLKKRIIGRDRHIGHPSTKQSRNLLEGYREAVESGAKKVFLIEDDIFIANDFFKWHENAQELHPLTIATANNNTKFQTDNDLEKCYIGADADYQSLGVCWDAKLLERLILPYVTEAYYRSPVTYCMHTFPHSIIGMHFVEQDGLIRRCLQGKRRALFPNVARAFHAGFIGYNRKGKRPEGRTVEERAERVKEIANNVELLKNYVARPEYLLDSMPVNLIGNKWSKLCL